MPGSVTTMSVPCKPCSGYSAEDKAVSRSGDVGT